MVNDESGGRLILRGTNVSGDAKYRVDHLPPYGEADFARLRDELGVNAIRLLVFWEAIEPEPGRYDDVYLAGVRERVDAAGRAGLHVVIDMHQDLWGRGFGSAGAPSWAGDPRDYDRHRRERLWMVGYFRREVARTFDRFWEDRDRQDAFARAWGRVVEAVRDAPAVLGYDLLNEPFWGSAHPDRFDRSIAPAFYARVIDAVRAIDPHRYVLVEPAPIANAGWRSRFVPPHRPKLIFAPHFYPPIVELGLGWPGARAQLDRHLRTLRTAADAAGLPLVVGEVGVRREMEASARFIEEAIDALDAARMGFFQWDLGRSDRGYALLERDGSPSSLARAFARPAPSRIAGELVDWRWNRSSSTLELAWNEDGSARGDTVVSLPTLASPSGFDVALEDGGEIRIDGTRAYVPQRGAPRALRASPR